MYESEQEVLQALAEVLLKVYILIIFCPNGFNIKSMSYFSSRPLFLHLANGNYFFLNFCILATTV